MKGSRKQDVEPTDEGRCFPLLSYNVQHIEGKEWRLLAFLGDNWALAQLPENSRHWRGVRCAALFHWTRLELGRVQLSPQLPENSRQWRRVRCTVLFDWTRLDRWSVLLCLPPYAKILLAETNLIRGSSRNSGNGLYFGRFYVGHAKQPSSPKKCNYRAKREVSQILGRYLGQKVPQPWDTWDICLEIFGVCRHWYIPTAVQSHVQFTQVPSISTITEILPTSISKTGGWNTGLWHYQGAWWMGATSPKLVTDGRGWTRIAGDQNGQTDGWASPRDDTKTSI